MYIKDIAWVQLDVTQENINILDNIDLDRLYFHRSRGKAPTYNHVSKYDIDKLNDIMFGIGFKLVKVENMGFFDRLLYVWNDEFFFPIKEAHGVGSFLIKDLNINMRGLAHSSSNWLYMLINNEGKAIESTLSLQHELLNGTYVMHRMKDKETLIRINTFLNENDRDVLVKYDTVFYSLFKTVDYALTILRFV